MNILGVRNPEAAQIAVEKAIDMTKTKGKVYYATCDTGDMNSVKSFALKVQEQFQQVHVLINNGKLTTKSHID